jgi:hypothetical protein
MPLPGPLSDKTVLFLLIFALFTVSRKPSIADLDCTWMLAQK